MSGYKLSDPMPMSVEDAVSSGYADIQELADEMGSWRDNMSGTGLESTQKYSDVETAADTLEGVSEPDVNSEWFTNDAITVYHTVKRSKRASPSRSVRLDNALSYLRAVVEQAETEIDEIETRLNEKNAENDDEDDTARKDNLENLRDELQNTIDELEGVEFPGMFG